MVTPKDIENKMFKVSFKGYNVDEVDDFLQEICDSYLEIYIENKKLREQLLAMRDETKPLSYAKMPKQAAASAEMDAAALKEAKKVAEEAQSAARSMAEKVSKKLDEDAQRLLDMHKEVLKYKEEVSAFISASDEVVTEKLTPPVTDTEEIPCVKSRA